jgi:hypothetical protein
LGLDYGSRLPRGEELLYGCEVRLVDADMEALAPGEGTDVDLIFWAISEPGPRMDPGGSFSLRDGVREIGVGTILG